MKKTKYNKTKLDKKINLEKKDRFSSILKKLNNITKNFFFVQIGGYDGVSFDLIHKYIEKYQWHGIIFEPCKHPFSQLQHTYKNNSNITLVNMAISNNSGKEMITKFKPIKTLLEWTKRLFHIITQST